MPARALVCLEGALTWKAPRGNWPWQIPLWSGRDWQCSVRLIVRHIAFSSSLSLSVQKPAWWRSSGAPGSYNGLDSSCHSWWLVTSMTMFVCPAPSCPRTLRWHSKPYLSFLVGSMTSLVTKQIAWLRKFQLLGCNSICLAQAMEFCQWAIPRNAKVTCAGWWAKPWPWLQAKLLRWGVDLGLLKDNFLAGPFESSSTFWVPMFCSLKPRRTCLKLRRSYEDSFGTSGWKDFRGSAKDGWHSDQRGVLHVYRCLLWQWNQVWRYRWCSYWAHWVGG